MMLTSNSQEENVQHALSAGARDFIVKPFEFGMLLQRVRRLLEHSKPVPVAQAPVTIVTPTGAQVRPRFRLTPVILVVDDQAAITEIAAALLSERFDVATSLGGANALSAAIRLRPDRLRYLSAWPGRSRIYRSRPRHFYEFWICRELARATDHPFLQSRSSHHTRSWWIGSWLVEHAIVRRNAWWHNVMMFFVEDRNVLIR